MNLTSVAAIVLALFAAGYRFYSRFLAQKLGLDDARSTPACTMNDGMDYVPAKAPFLLGQHFSAIAAAGPIVGPILAGIAYGWLPTLLWIVLGAIFVGAVHDFSALVGSVRHQAGSIARIVEAYMGRSAYVLFLLFIFFSLVYVITAFSDLTANSFAEIEYGGGVASSSILYLILAVIMGAAMRFLRLSLIWATAVFLPLLLAVIWAGPHIPLVFPQIANLSSVMLWGGIVLGYCFLASILPVWLLLQPRGYLGGIFLYVALLAGLIGLTLGGIPIRYPAFIGLKNASGFPLFPMLFVTVACGACSGFHGLVSSGTTSKQIAREGDCRSVGYGGMLLEGLVALIALATVMMLPYAEEAVRQPPDRIYAQGLATFVQQFGIPYHFAMAFVLLAFATFIFDTLDVATRLGRYILQELTGWKGILGNVTATLLTLLLPAWFLAVKVTDSSGDIVPAWRLFWTVFGTSNQLLAGLTLLGLTIWLKRSGKSWVFAAVPGAFMMGVTLWALAILLKEWLSKVKAGFPLDPVGVACLLLMGLAVALLLEGSKAFLRGTRTA